MKRLSDRFLQLGVLAGATGMLLGVWMGETEDFTLMPVHAHINLLGWVSMMLYGIVYRAIPDATRGRLPVAHFFLNVASFVVMIPALTLVLLGNRALAPVLGASAVALWISMALFAVIIIRATWRSAGATDMGQPS
ncbi:MAG TPA: hypothetical protein VM659_09970 [Dongiaceae bacterium]|nr:hypothetical protein [Dongiaceae bacterium]